MEAIAKLRNIRVTPMKARRVVNLIRGKQATEALGILKFAPQSASEPIYKLVASAVANAQVKGEAAGAIVDVDDLIISKAFVDEGVTLKGSVLVLKAEHSESTSAPATSQWLYLLQTSLQRQVSSHGSKSQSLRLPPGNYH